MSDAIKARLCERIDNILGSTYDLNKVTRKIFKAISKAFDTGNFYMALYNRRENTIHFVIYTIEGKERQMASRKFSKGLTEYIIRSKKPLLINRHVRAICKTKGIKPVGKSAKSWLGVPMINKGNVEGVMTVQDYHRHNAYSIEDEKLLMRIAARAAVVIANTRLIEEEVKTKKELAMLNLIADRLTKSLDVDKICENVTRSIRQHFPFFNVAVYMEQAGELSLKKRSRGYGEDVRGERKIPLGLGVIGRVAKTGKMILVNDVKKSKLYRRYSRKSLSKSEVAIPLKITQKTIGVLNIESNELNAFDDNSVRILELIADRLGVALYNARLYEEAMENAKEFSVSFDIAKSLISTRELDDVLDKILTSIKNTFGYSNIAIFLIDKTKNQLYIRAAYGYDARIQKNLRLKIGEQGICGKVAARGTMFYAPDIKNIPYYVEGKKSVRSEAALPLKIRGEVIGVLDIESDEVDGFSERELRMFSVFASQASIAIENARLFDETKALSLTDALTRTANRRHFDLMLENELKKARGYSRPLSLAMVDLDNFKKFNDRHGHLAGDKMLVHIVRTLQKNIRDTDFVARYGGEEFAIIFPETYNSAAARVSERVRQAVEKEPLSMRGHGRQRITISIGVAAYPTDAETLADLVGKADKALYRAKQAGKNRVEIFTE